MFRCLSELAAVRGRSLDNGQFLNSQLFPTQNVSCVSLSSHVLARHPLFCKHFTLCIWFFQCMCTTRTCEVTWCILALSPKRQMCKCIVCVHINSLSLSLWQLCVIKIMHLQPQCIWPWNCAYCLLQSKTVLSMSAFSLNRSFYLAINTRKQMRISLSFVMDFVFISGVCQGKHHYFFHTYLLAIWKISHSKYYISV